MSSARIRKAVIPVAGFGTRFLPATKAMPKEMLPIVDKPTIQYIVEEMVASGIEEIVLVTNRSKRAIEDHFDRSFELEVLLEKNPEKKAQLEEVRRLAHLAKFVYVRQEEMLGNGHALLCAREVVGDEPFAFAYGDDIIESTVPATQQLIDSYAKFPGTTFGVIEVPQAKVSSYGVIDPEEIPGEPHTVKVKRMVEKPAPESAPSRFASCGRYVFTPEIFDSLAQIKPGKSGEIWVVDGVDHLRAAQPIYARKFQDAIYHDCGNKAEFIKTVISYALKRPDLKNEIETYIKSLI